MDSLAERAYEHYKYYQVEEALSIYRRAYDIAAVIEDREKMMKYRQWEGHCLHHLERFREASSVLMTLSQTVAIAPHEYFSSVVDQVDIAIKLPLALPKIKSLLHEAYRIMREYSLQTSKSVVLIQESNLFRMRYDYKRALEKALEALASHHNDAKTRYNKLVYYRGILDNLTSLNSVPEIKVWLLELQECDTDRTNSKEIIFLGFSSEVAILEGKAIEAFDYAKQCIIQERKITYDSFSSLRLVVKAGIMADRLNEIRSFLAEMLSLRRTECKNRRYQIYLYCGDYYTALFRQKREVQYINCAKKYYNRARNIGIEIDSLFDCNGRQMEISQRLEYVDKLSE